MFWRCVPLCMAFLLGVSQCACLAHVHAAMPVDHSASPHVHWDGNLAHHHHHHHAHHSSSPAINQGADHEAGAIYLGGGGSLGVRTSWAQPLAAPPTQLAAGSILPAPTTLFSSDEGVARAPELPVYLKVRALLL